MRPNGTPVSSKCPWASLRVWANRLGASLPARARASTSRPVWGSSQVSSDWVQISHFSVSMGSCSPTEIHTVASAMCAPSSSSTTPSTVATPASTPDVSCSSASSCSSIFLSRSSFEGSPEDVDDAPLSGHTEYARAPASSTASVTAMAHARRLMLTLEVSRLPHHRDFRLRGNIDGHDRRPARRLGVKARPHERVVTGRQAREGHLLLHRLVDELRVV